MLILKSDIRGASGLAFSPDGLSLVAVGHNHVQVWPRWLDAPPRPAVAGPSNLERFAFSPDGTRVFLYLSANSRTRVLTVATGRDARTAVPSSGPAWFYFDADGGFFIASHNRGKLSRLDHDPALKKSVRKRWTVERESPRSAGDDRPTAIGSHYRFGAVCGPAGVFVALEYRYGAGEPVDGLVVRSVEDGSLLRREPVSDDDTHRLLDGGLKLSIHPSGTYFALPVRNRVRLWPLADGVRAPKWLAVAPRAECQAVAFHPAGGLLAAAAGTVVTLYDTATWRVTRTFTWKVGYLRAVCFSPDGTRAAAISSAGKLVVWDVDL